MDRLFLWDETPGGNVDHTAEHGLTPEEVESAFDNIEVETNSNTTGRPAIFGRTLDGEFIFVVYELDRDNDGREYVYVRTAYVAEDDE